MTVVKSQLLGPVALVGGNGMLGRMVANQAPKNLELLSYDLPEFDMTDRSQVSRVMATVKPRIIINSAAFTAVDACEEQEVLATRVNADGVANLAAAARDLGATLVHISTDYVFSGKSESPYREDSPTGPLSAYGRSKLKGYELLLASDLASFYIIRTSWLYGPWGKNFVETILRLAAEREELRIVADQVGSPTFTGDLATAIFNLLKFRTPYGIYHFSNLGVCSWFEFAQEILTLGRSFELPLKTARILPIRTKEYPLPAVRPTYSVFDKSKYLAATGATIPTWQGSLQKYFTLR